MAKEKRTLARSARPPEVKRVVPVRKVDPKSSLEGWICSVQIWGFDCHWNGNKTTPHFKDEKQCPGCQAEHPKRYKGFLLLFEPATRKKFWFELTPLAAEGIFEQYEDESLRGCYFKVRREQPRDKAPMICEVWRPDQQRQDLPPDESPVPTLSVLWRLNGEIC